MFLTRCTLYVTIRIFIYISELCRFSRFFAWCVNELANNFLTIYPFDSIFGTVMHHTWFYVLKFNFL